MIGLHYIDRLNLRTSIGYYLGQQFQKKGIMTLSVKALIRYVFEELKLNRIEIRMAINNEPSRAIAERLGFIKEGILRENEQLNGRASSSYVYSLLKAEYESQTRYSL